MKFWEKFWKLVSKKDLVFVTIIFAIVIVMTFVETATKVKVTFGDESVDIEAPRYSMNIPYEMVDSIELTEMPDRGEVVEGTDDMVSRTGTWENETWGEYYVCANLNSTNCVVVRLADGRIFVFSNKNNETTAENFETLEAYLTE